MELQYGHTGSRKAGISTLHSVQVVIYIPLFTEYSLKLVHASESALTSSLASSSTTWEHSRLYYPGREDSHVVE